MTAYNLHIPGVMSARELLLTSPQVAEAKRKRRELLEEIRRLRRERYKVLSGVEDALLALSLDDAGEEIKNIYKEIQRASYRYTNSLEVNAQHPGEFSHEHVEGALQTMEAKIIELREQIRARLKELEEPI